MINILKKLGIVLGIVLYIIWTIYAFWYMYRIFSFFRPLWALLNFNRYTYGWIFFTGGFLIGYYIWLDPPPKKDENKKE